MKALKKYFSSVILLYVISMMANIIQLSDGKDVPIVYGYDNQSLEVANMYLNNDIN